MDQLGNIGRRVWTVSFVKNEQDMMPFFLRHYGTFAENMVFFDDSSTDATREIIRNHRNTDLREAPSAGLKDDHFLSQIDLFSKHTMGHCDWLIWVDIDEFVYHPDMLHTLASIYLKGYEVVKTDGYNMAGDGLPEDDHWRQIYEINPMGVSSPVYSKPIIFRPESNIRWKRGRHDLEKCKPRVCKDSGIKLLHYRYLGYEYTKMRNLKNYDNVGDDKACAWTCDPDFKGDHSPEYAERIKKEAFNVLMKGTE